MQRKITPLEHAVKVVALCLPAVAMALAGLGLGRRPAATLAGRQPTKPTSKPAAGRASRSG
jgi:hypothetical protein